MSTPNTQIIVKEADLPAIIRERQMPPAMFNSMREVYGHPSPEMLVTVLDYCQSRKLDPLKKPVHIVSVWSPKANGGRGAMVETIWPSIAEIRTTAMRTGQYAGKSETRWGDIIEAKVGDVQMSYPEWCEITVYRLLNGHKCEFPGPRVYWLETYAVVKNGTPNSMWQKRPRGQLEKCAEAAALRAAFPEELGNQYAAEEMAGQTVDMDVTAAAEGGAATESGEAAESGGKQRRRPSVPRGLAAAKAAATETPPPETTPPSPPPAETPAPVVEAPKGEVVDADFEVVAEEETKEEAPPPETPPPSPADDKAPDDSDCKIVAISTITARSQKTGQDIIVKKVELEGDFKGEVYLNPDQVPGELVVNKRYRLHITKLGGKDVIANIIKQL